MLALVILEGVAVALLALLVVGLLRSHAEILRRLHELGAGLYDDELPSAGTGSTGTTGGGVTMAVDLRDRPPPTAPPELRTRADVAPPRPGATTSSSASDIVGVSPAGAPTALGIVGAPQATLLAFLSSGCATCADFWQAFATGAGVHLPGGGTRLVVVTKGPEHESQASVQALAPPGVTVVMSSQAFADYGVEINPYFILVDGPTGRIRGEGAAATWAQVVNLLGKAVADGDAGRRTRGATADARVEAELAAAGIGPGHPSLYPDRLVASTDDAPAAVVAEAPERRGADVAPERRGAEQP